MELTLQGDLHRLGAASQGEGVVVAHPTALLWLHAHVAQAGDLETADELGTLL